MFRSRFSVNAAAASAGVANFPDGTIGSGAVALWLRSPTMVTSLWSTSELELSGRATAGVFRIPCEVLNRKSSDNMMCSAHSATDHAVGDGLNFHCASVTPAMLSRKYVLDFCSCSSKNDRSESVNAPSPASSGAAARTQNANTFFMTNSPLLDPELGRYNLGNT